MAPGNCLAEFLGNTGFYGPKSSPEDFFLVESDDHQSKVKRGLLRTPLETTNKGKSRWHSYHVLVNISPILTYLLGTVPCTLTMMGLEDHPASFSDHFAGANC